MFKYAVGQGPATSSSTLQLSREDGGLEEQEEENGAVIGFWSAFIWLVGMTVFIALLSEYVVGTIEDISLGVALGSATQISMFVDGTSHYMKRVILVLCYVDIAACFFVYKVPQDQMNMYIGIKPFTDLFTSSLAGLHFESAVSWSCFLDNKSTAMYLCFSRIELSTGMDALRKQASKLREQVSKQQQEFQKDFVRAAEALTAIGYKHIEAETKLSEDCCRYGTENDSDTMLAKAVAIYGDACKNVEKETEDLNRLLSLQQVLEPLRAMITSGPLEDARHLAQRYSRMRQEAEAQVALTPLVRWLSQNMQRAAAPPQPPRAAGRAEDALAEGEGEDENRGVQDGNVGAEGNENIEGGGGGGNRWWGIVKEVQMIVFGFITSLLPGFHNID
ncbi:SH3 domain-containing protein 3 [Linum grandiflorum]